MKGKYIILSNFLWRQTHDDSDPHTTVAISFDMHKTLYENYYKIETKERFLVQMQLQTKSSGVHYWRFMAQRNIIYKHITRKKLVPQSKIIIESKPKLGQGRTGIRHSKSQPVDGITTSRSKSCEITKIPTTQNVTKNKIDFPSTKAINNQ